MIPVVEFEIYGVRARAIFSESWPVTGLNPVNIDRPSLSGQCVITCAIVGRGGGGKGQVVKAAGLAICHPSDMWKDEAGIKLAFQDAASNLYRQGKRRKRIEEPKYVDLFWSAYQRASHDRPPLEPPADLEGEALDLFLEDFCGER